MTQIRRNWTDEEVVLALGLYLATPYSRIRTNNPKIRELAACLGRTPGAVSRKLGNFAAHDIDVAKSGRKGLDHGSKVDKKIFEMFVGDRTNLKGEELYNEIELISKRMNINVGFIYQDWDEWEKLQVSEFADEPLRVDQETEAKRHVAMRRKQGFFRGMVMSSCGGRCVVSGCTIPSLLEAAHILPWSDFPDQRLNPANGIILNRFLHAAYDENLLGITPDGVLVASRLLKEKGGEGRFSAFTKDLDGMKIDFDSMRFRPDGDFLLKRYQDFRMTAEV